MALIVLLAGCGQRAFKEGYYVVSDEAFLKSSLYPVIVVRFTADQDPLSVVYLKKVDESYNIGLMTHYNDKTTEVVMGEPAVEHESHEWTLSETKVGPASYEVRTQQFVGTRENLPAFDRSKSNPSEQRNLRAVEKTEALEIIRKLLDKNKLGNDLACQRGFDLSCDQIAPGK